MPDTSFLIKTYGCQMNVRDSTFMADILLGAGWRHAAPQDVPGVVILNTCHIREKAAEKVYSQLGRLRRLKAQGAHVGVAGCVAQAQGEEMLRRAPVVDFIVGPQALHRLPELIAAAQRGQRRMALEFAPSDKFAKSHDPSVSAASFVTIQEGCDKFCTFCVVPYTRGREFSRPTAQITQEVRALAQKGVGLVILLGQNVNAWRDGSWGLGELLGHLATVEGVAWLSYTSSHPLDMDPALIAAHGTLKTLLPSLHLPVQSGSDRILKAMNRRHTAQDYLEIIARVRQARPDIAVSGDFIVGFPGETEADFEATLDLVRQIGYARGYAFGFSPRPGTPAADQKPVPPEITSCRLARLQALLDEQQRAFHEGTVGTCLPFLVEAHKEGQLRGRTRYLQRAHAQGDTHGAASLVGQIVPLRITEAYGHSVRGQILTS